MNNQSQTIKRGDINKCPACGAPISALAIKCPECGHEITNVSANSTIENITETLERIQNSSNLTREEKIEHKIQAIQNFPIPNTKEDLIEMLTICRANITSKAEDNKITNAWKAKTTHIISKSQILLKGDKDAEFLINSINSYNAGRKRKIRIIIISLTICIAIIIGGIIIFHKNTKAEIRNQNIELSDMKTSINRLIQDGEYGKAYEEIGNISNYIKINEIEPDAFESLAGDMYLKLVISLIREDALEDAAEVGLDYREKLSDESKWRNSQVFKVLIQECENKNIDDSPLR